MEGDSNPFGTAQLMLSLGGLNISISIINVAPLRRACRFRGRAEAKANHGHMMAEVALSKTLLKVLAGRECAYICPSKKFRLPIRG